MKMPLETIIALYPQAVAVGRTKLPPLTVGGWAALAVYGIDPMRARVSQECAAAAAAIISLGPLADIPSEAAVRNVSRSFSLAPNDVSKAVESVFNQAFITYIEPRIDDKSPKTVTPHGLGTPLEIAEFLIGEYGWSLKDALATPVSTAYALIAASRQRRGGKHKGFDYIEREYAKTLRGK